MTPLRIAIVVQGRFHAFDLARELIARGDHVTLFTTYPAWAVRRFGVEPSHVRSAWMQGGLTRALNRIPAAMVPGREKRLHTAFGAWAERMLAGTAWDVIHCWSGVSEELLVSPRVRADRRWLMRGSAHIAEQDRLLREEEQRTGTPLERPSEWMIAREQREYELADGVIVLSSFAARSFEASGYPRERTRVLPLGVNVAAFRAGAADVAERARRIRSGEPLRVLFAGALSLRKGLWDLLAVARTCAEQAPSMRFVLAGGITGEVRPLLATAGGNVEVLGRIAEQDLPGIYRRADLFLFPTIEDGFGMVLAQARAAGLPILCSSNCAGPDMIDEDVNGWVVPIRAPEAIVRHLLWCEAHRDAFAAMTGRAATGFAPRDWAAVAEDFDAMARETAPSAAVAVESPGGRA